MSSKDPFRIGLASAPAPKGVRRIGSHLPAPVRRAIGSTLRAIKPRPEQTALPKRPAPKRPQLSVVVVAENAEAYLHECLESLKRQTLKRFEVIVVDLGSSDDTLGVAQRWAAEDERFGVLDGPVTGLGTARNAGVAAARGEFLSFVQATDTVPRNALNELVASLRRTGSDFAAGSVQQVHQSRSRRPAWAVLTHDLDRTALRLADFPLALQDTVLTNRVFRTEFWRDQVGEFADESVAGETYAVVAATLRARHFDLLQVVASHQRTRLEPGALGVAGADLVEVEQRLHWLEETWRLLQQSVDAPTQAAWLASVLDNDLFDLIGDAAADAALRDAVHRAALHWLERAGVGRDGSDDRNGNPGVESDPTDALAEVRVEPKLRLWLAAAGRWRELELMMHHFRLFGPTLTTAVSGQTVCVDEVDVPGLVDTPARLRQLARGQTAFSGCVERLRWAGSVLVVDGWAFIRGVDLAGAAVEITAVLVEPVSGRELPAEIGLVERPAANRWSRFRYQDVAPGGFTLRFDTTTLPAPRSTAAELWQLVWTVRARGLERSGPIASVIREGVARRMPVRDLLEPSETTRVMPQLSSVLGLSLEVRPEQVRAVHLEDQGDGVMRATLEVVDDSVDGLVAVRAKSAGAECAAALEPVDGRRWQAVLELPLGGTTPTTWRVRAVDADGHEHRVSWPAEQTYGERVGDRSGRAGWVRTFRGHCELVSDQRSAEAMAVMLDASWLTVEADLIGLSTADCAHARLVGGREAVDVTEVTAVADGRVRLRFAATAPRWDGPQLPLTSDTYRVLLDDAGLAVTCSDALLAWLPAEGLTDTHRYLVGRSRSGTDLTITLSGPQTDDEYGRYAQQQLGAWYADTDFGATRSVLFQCYRGEFATDSQLAVHRELQRRGSDLQLLWGVADLSVPLPPGGQALLIESREWYAALGASQYLCRNVDVERYFRKRPHQQYLQTFHGYPFKSMGASLWRAQGRAESVVQVESGRRSAAWDAIVVPEDFCTDLYRREYAFGGRSLATGYPRNDSLVDTDAAAVRARVLSGLGIDPARTVVLYAPTWRDTVATSPWTAKLFLELDLEALADQLGDDYAVLLRGHNFNLREGHIPTSPSITDVSGYPEINDLILAADVAVLDYSSLRFDWLITDKPVVFFVPDLEDYLQARTVLFDFGPTAPGPWLRYTAEVGAALLELPALTAEYAAARAAFNRRFNTLHDGQATRRVVDAFFG